MRDEQLNRYSRHIMLGALGIEGQENINRARVLVIGAGGLASPVALYLAAAGVGEIVVCDDDRVDLTNLQRQIVFASNDIGKPKAEAAAAAMTRLNPEVKVRALQVRFAEDNAAELLAGVDVVVDASDNYATRHLANRAARKMKKPLVFGAAIGLEGQVAVFDGRDESSPCYHCLFAESDRAEEERCALMGVFSPLVGMVGAMQAAECLKLLAMPTGETLAGRLLAIDAATMRIREIKLPQDPKCPVCCP